MRGRARTWRGLCTIVAMAAVLGCGASRTRVAEPPAPRYVFAWPFADPAALAPRGGTTRGAAVTLTEGPSPEWQALQADGLSSYERDRAAILAMAGDYRTSFDFLETVVFDPPHRPARPYRSWGTERVYVEEDRGDFIVLQHVLVMVVVDDEGERSGPLVQKHWRQDWQYEPTHVVEHVGRRVWRRRAIPDEVRRGQWSQSVYQVDDTPRYASLGRWQHRPSFSAWTGERTARPLPRREHTARSDYDVLAGMNRHTILPSGWVHEQDNLKQVLGDSLAAPRTAKAREIGVNRYERIRDFDFSAADAYREATAPLWSVVRDAWTERLAAAPALRIVTQCEGTPVFMRLFEYAHRLETGPAPPEDEIEAFVDRLLDCIVEPAGA